MANKFYPKGAEKIMRAAINFYSDTIKAVIVSDAYTFSTAHEFLTDLGTVVGTAQTLTTKSTTGGVFDADDLDFGAVAPGPVCKAVVFYKDTGSAATSPLIEYADEVTGFPMTANGGGITVPISNGAYKIISLV
jgi:hypothetical protein